MNWDAIGAVGEILGAMAVFITLVYLSIQIRQGTKATRLRTAHETFQLSFEMVSIFSRGENSEIWSKFRREGWKSLSPEQQVVAGSIAICLFTTYDSHYHNYLERTLSQEIHDSYSVRLTQQLTVPAIREWWRHNGIQYTASFQKYVNGLVLKLDGN